MNGRGTVRDTMRVLQLVRWRHGRRAHKHSLTMLSTRTYSTITVRKSGATTGSPYLHVGRLLKFREKKKEKWPLHRSALMTPIICRPAIYPHPVSQSVSKTFPMYAAAAKPKQYVRQWHVAVLTIAILRFDPLTKEDGRRS
jgi:hypothetical protein